MIISSITISRIINQFEQWFYPPVSSSVDRWEIPELAMEVWFAGKIIKLSMVDFQLATLDDTGG
jgi:hypothetical protein